MKNRKKRNKKVKRHIKWKSFLIFLCLLFVIAFSFHYLWNLHVKNIFIVGNSILKDYEIIEASGLKEYPKMNKYSKNAIEKNIKELDLVDKVKVKR